MAHALPMKPLERNMHLELGEKYEIPEVSFFDQNAFCTKTWEFENQNVTKLNDQKYFEITLVQNKASGLTLTKHAHCCGNRFRYICKTDFCFVILVVPKVKSIINDFR